MRRGDGRVVTGLERIVREPGLLPRGARVGLLCNPASVDAALCHASKLLHRSPAINLTALFGPQHGIAASCQDNMIETPHRADRATGLPVYSLYSDTRRPTPAMLSEIDCLVVDLQDVGCRVYTYLWTLSLAMEACAEAAIPVFVLDRPNPIGGAVEGNVLERACRSFVGRYPLPMRHGMTMGELALFLNTEEKIGCNLTVVAMEGYERDALFRETGLPWVLPSPNMPAPETALVYPGMVLLEGTAVSEGRGTTRPFEIFGAPFIDGEALCEHLDGCALPGVVFRPLVFEPTFQKFAGQACGGAQIHVTDAAAFRPYRVALNVLAALRRLYPAAFSWRMPPYEYEAEKMPIDILAGTALIREAVDAGESVDELEERWQPELAKFREVRTRYLLYPSPTP